VIEFNAAWAAGLNGCDPDKVLSAIVVACEPISHAPAKSQVTGVEVPDNAVTGALLPCWVFACRYKMAQKSQEQSWPIKHH
jgi:hypothetical protein